MPVLTIRGRINRYDSTRTRGGIAVDHTKRVFESNEMNNELISKKIIIVPHERVTSSFQSGFLIALISVGIIVSISSVNKRKRKKK